MKIITRFKQLIFGLLTATILCTPQTVFADNDIAEDVIYIRDVGSNVQSTQGFGFTSINPIGPDNQIWDPVISAGGLSEWARFYSSVGGLVYNGYGYQRYGPNLYNGSDKFYLSYTDPARGIGVLQNAHNHWDSNANEYFGGFNGRYGYTTTDWKRTVTSFYLNYQTRVVDGRQVCSKGNINYYNVPWGEKRALTAPTNAEKTAYTVTFNPASGQYNNTTSNTSITYRYTFNGFSGNIYDLDRTGNGTNGNITCTGAGITAGSVTRPNNYTCTLTNDVNGSFVQGNFTVPGLSRYSGCTYNDNGSGTSMVGFSSRTDCLNAQYYRPAISLGTPTRVGYIFNGWKCSDNNKVYTGSIPQSDLGPQGDFTMTAQWTPIRYTINFNPQGGTVNPTSKSLRYDEAYTFPTPVRSGYKFLGWYR